MPRANRRGSFTSVLSARKKAGVDWASLTSGTLLYSNDFTALGAGWTGDWTVAGGVLVPGTAFMVRDLGAGKVDMVVRTKITALPTTAVETGAVLRRLSGSPTGINQGHRWTVDNANTLRVYPDAGQNFVRNKGTGIINVGSEVRFYAKGTTLELWVDQALIHRELGVANDFGTLIGYGSGGGTARFDDLFVYTAP